MATACESRLNMAGQSAEPTVIWALTLIRPIERAASGSLRMTMNRAPARGAKEKPMALTRGTLERRALRVSAHNADARLFIALLR